MASRAAQIRFLLNEEEVCPKECGPGDTLLDFLRLKARLVGTKEGCAEGDCGACSVLVGQLAGDGQLVYQLVNACIRLMPSLNACHVVTVENLARGWHGLHPVQEAMRALHASQCGFCTPGFVMALYALWLNGGPAPSRSEVETALQGNLCRCTGYRPIVDAGLHAFQLGAPCDDLLMRTKAQIAERLRRIETGTRIGIESRADAPGGAGVHGAESARAQALTQQAPTQAPTQAIVPRDVDDLAQILSECPGARIVAGATDVGLWVTKQMRDIAPAVFIGNLAGLQRIEAHQGGLTLGAGVTYAQCQAPLVARYAHLEEYWKRIAGPQIRNSGTIGGNIANGSPIGDTPPVFIALGARLVLRAGSARRELPLEDFFIDYGRQDLRPGEFIEAIHLPEPAKGALHGAHKVSKRRDEDISTVCAGFQVVVDDQGIVTDARLAYGGMAATPKRARTAEKALVGMSWSRPAIAGAMAHIAGDFTPLTDLRATSAYRLRVAANLLLRFFLESTGAPGAAGLAR